MKRTLFALTLSFFFSSGTMLHSQTILFEEDYESSPVSSMSETGMDTLANGPPSCGATTRGKTSDFNSSNVDYKNSQNSSYFMGLNPEAPCGGYYTSSVESDTFDLSGKDSIYFSCRYLIGNSLNWGGIVFELTFYTSETSFTIDTASFSNKSDWTKLTKGLPDSLERDSVWFELAWGGGDGVGLDDFTIYGMDMSSLERKDLSNTALKVHPNPFTRQVTVRNPFPERSVNLTVYNMTGRKILRKSAERSKRVSWNLGKLQEGVYILGLKSKGGEERYQRILKR